MNKRIIDTPVGKLELSALDGKLLGIRAAGEAKAPILKNGDPVLDETQRQLAQYFRGERTVFDLPLQLNGSPFDCAVWRQLLAIPFGAVQTYGQIAKALGMPKAARAVGGACSRNPLLIVVPCHRVIAASGRLTGFAAGIAMKRALLALEGWDVLNDCVRKR